MYQVEGVKKVCPYCGADFEVLVDTSEEEQSYFEDCSACCAPVQVEVRCDHDGELLELELRTDRE